LVLSVGLKQGRWETGSGVKQSACRRAFQTGRLQEIVLSWESLKQAGQWALVVDDRDGGVSAYRHGCERGGRVALGAGNAAG